MWLSPVSFGTYMLVGGTMSMAKESSARNKDHQRRKLDFEWSLKPITMLVRCVGIPLNFRNHKQFDNGGWLLWFVMVFGILLFCIDALCQFYMTAITVYYAIELQSSKNSSYSSALKWNVCINSMNNIILVLGSHGLLLTVSLVNWPHLIRVLHHIENNCFYKEQDFRKFRTPCFVALALSLTEWMLYIINLCFAWADNFFIYKLMIIGIVLFFVLVFISFYFLCALCWIAYLMLKALGEEIKESHIEKYHSSHLKLWKTKYFCIEEFVHYINCCFGPFLLLLTTSYFVRMTNNSFFIFSLLTKSSDKEQNTRIYPLIIFLVKDWICFVALTYIPSLLRQEAINTIMGLKNLQFKDNALMCQLQFLKMELSLSIPQITAAGFFDINCKLILTMVSTTLTYLIIFYQFDSIEENNNLDSTT